MQCFFLTVLITVKNKCLFDAALPADYNLYADVMLTNCGSFLRNSKLYLDVILNKLTIDFNKFLLLSANYSENNLNSLVLNFS